MSKNIQPLQSIAKNDIPDAQNVKILLFPTNVPVPALHAMNYPKIVLVLALLVKMLLLIAHVLTPQGQNQMKIKF